MTFAALSKNPSVNQFQAQLCVLLDGDNSGGIRQVFAAKMRDMRCGSARVPSVIQVVRQRTPMQASSWLAGHQLCAPREHNAALSAEAAWHKLPPLASVAVDLAGEQAPS